MSEKGNNWQHDNPAETKGWEIVRQLNLSLKNPATSTDNNALECRKLLAEYFRLNTGKPSRLHSAILSCAVKMAMAFPDFHFVPFLNIWGLENLRPEDSEEKVEEGKRFPSLVEKLTKAYAYSQMFHPEEHLESGFEQIMKPVFQRKGYRSEEKDGHVSLVSQVLVTRVFPSEVKGRKMTFVTLLTTWGEELVTEVHTMTRFIGFDSIRQAQEPKLTTRIIRYENLPYRLFNVILRTSENGNLRVEAAFQSSGKTEDCFPTAVGYVEHIDMKNHHIHIFDNQSRHFVGKFITTDITEGQYVRFVPIIPKVGNFKSAVICNVVSEGADAFGYRDVVVTYVNAEQGYCAWELMPDGDGKVVPIMESGAQSDAEPATKGYISKETIIKVSGFRFQDSSSFSDDAMKAAEPSVKLPKKGDRLKVIVFLKRGKDGKKKPFVADYIPSPSIS